jgi:hypothetical protein
MGSSGSSTTKGTKEENRRGRRGRKTADEEGEEKRKRIRGRKSGIGIQFFISYRCKSSSSVVGFSLFLFLISLFFSIASFSHSPIKGEPFGFRLRLHP